MTDTQRISAGDSRTRRVLAGTVAGVVQQVVTIAMQIALVPLIIDRAGAETVGAYAILSQLIGWGSITNLGLGVTAWRFMAEAHGLGDGGVRFATILRTTRFLYWMTNLAFAVFVLAAGMATSYLVTLTPDLAARLRLAALLYAVWSVLRTPLTLYGDALYATQNVALASLTTTLASLLRLAGSIVFVWAGLGLVGLTVAAIISEFLSGVANSLLFSRLHPEIGAVAADRDGPLMRRMLSFGSTFLISTLSNQLATNTSGLVFGALFGAGAVSMAYTSQMPANVLGQTIWKLSDSAGPAVTQLHAQRQQAGLRRAYLTLLRSSLACGLPLAVGLVAFSRPAVSLWVGADQYAGGLFTLAVAVVTVIEIILHLQLVFFIAQGEVRGYGIATLIANVVKIVVWLASGMAIGLGGMMVVAAAVQVPILVYACSRLHRALGARTGEVLRESLLRPMLIAGCCAGFVASGALLWPWPHDWPSLIGWATAYGAIWALLCWLLGCTAAERASILAACRRQLNRWAGHAGTA